ncbi:MAG TPA: putative quinol monooxygenase [Xanthobacteraceae bacterium]|jgi:quinol monooxygenase YgiN
MRESVLTSVAAVALVLGAGALCPMHSRPAAAQTAPLYVNVVDLQIVPGQIDKFLAAVEENGTAAVKEPGCREFDIAVSSKDANHLALFEVWDNAAALDAHRATDHFKNFMATTKDMVAKRDLRAMSSVAINGKSPDHSGLLINEVDLDIVPAQFDAFLAAAKINGAATPRDQGAHEFNIVVSQKEPHHVLFFEVYDNAPALDVHRQSEHFKTYQEATKGMVANRNVNQFTSVAMNSKAM